ncbi:hypothetical protein AK830_g8296 [Neonectria ditissima]|uniref:NADP-dependent oxidoreductase domain-containing protein n=1 Tax=Neonectria ditissima TaxID=78410 RepID=A0A0P7BBQ6_9HYPO|nr:hypothetical protein AK830_g8296 [Neonectria ditissima]
MEGSLSASKSAMTNRNNISSSVGDTSIDSTARFDSPDEVKAFLETFAARGHDQVDTARMYSPLAPGTSEPRLGAVTIGDKFSVDTKVISREPGDHSKQNILRDINDSLEALKVKQINIEYLHVPDRATKFEEACEAMDQAHREGKIKHWGICSYTAEEVQRFVDICEERGFVKPSVYQGQYNLIVRGGEKELFPVLRKNGIAFYAFSPAGGGFFAGNHKNVQAGGRFDQSAGIMAATDKALEIASQHGIGGHAAALRWTAHHSLLKKEHEDAIIVGASSTEQLRANLEMIEQGPLPHDVVAVLEAVYEEIGIDDELPYHLVLSPTVGSCDALPVPSSKTSELLYVKMEFIPASHPARTTSTELKRQAHSHAARVAHARARRLRVANYMHEKGTAGETSSRKASGDQQHYHALVIQDKMKTSVPKVIPGAFEHEPMTSFKKSLTFQERFMLDHYIKVVMPYLNNYCPVLQHLGEWHKSMRNNWILHSSTDVDLLRGFLLGACRHLSMVNSEEKFAEIAVQYKLSYVKSLRETISTQSPSSKRIAVTKALVLAFDEIMVGDISMATNHVLGAIRIVETGGGPQAIGLSDFVLQFLCTLIYGKRLLDLDPKIYWSSMFMKPEWTQASAQQQI